MSEQNSGKPKIDITKVFNDLDLEKIVEEAEKEHESQNAQDVEESEKIAQEIAQQAEDYLKEATSWEPNVKPTKTS